MTAPGPCNIVLAGFMGTGKSAVGRRLAERLERRFIDTDTVVEQEAGKSISRIFADHGEPGFRERERRAVRRIAQERTGVIAVGGGAFLDDENAAVMKASGLVVCLTARPDVILRRVGRDTNRPLLRGPYPLENIRRLLSERADAYTRADITIDTSDLTPDEVVETVLRALADTGFSV